MSLVPKGTYGTSLLNNQFLKLIQFQKLSIRDVFDIVFSVLIFRSRGYGGKPKGKEGAPGTL
jgi:hypothetical protein